MFNIHKEFGLNKNKWNARERVHWSNGSEGRRDFSIFQFPREGHPNAVVIWCNVFPVIIKKDFVKPPGVGRLPGTAAP